jgi:hypothetical protein
VAPLDSITEEEWRIYLPIAAGAELAVEPEPAPQQAAEQSAAEQSAAEQAAAEHAHAEEFPAGKLPVLQEVDPEANGAAPDSEGTQAHSDAPGGQPDTVEPQ